MRREVLYFYPSQELPKSPIGNALLPWEVCACARECMCIVMGILEQTSDDIVIKSVLHFLQGFISCFAVGHKLRRGHTTMRSSQHREPDRPVILCSEQWPYSSGHTPLRSWGRSRYWCHCLLGCHCQHAPSQRNTEHSFKTLHFINHIYNHILEAAWHL